jgi:monoamine oxidase
LGPGLAATLTARPIFGADRPAEPNRFRRGKVLVIGAGMAGLMAARTLESHGFAVTVVEARQRGGGRIWTIDLGGQPVDLGLSRLIRSTSPATVLRAMPVSPTAEAETAVSCHLLMCAWDSRKTTVLRHC